MKDEIYFALLSELEMQSSYLQDRQVDTIYFGGGTPSIFDSFQINSLIQKVGSLFKLSSKPEITLEANPDDLTKEKLNSLFQSGVNRLSIGVQSFDDVVLRFLNRAHSSKEAKQCIEDARKAGFNNLSLDLIYAIPGQNKSVWLDNINTALAFAPEHLSAYSLTIEEKTAFGKWVKKGALKVVDEKASAEEYELLMEVAAENGYEHYEISNFCRPGFYSRHNASYWQQTHYLGLGPSAHSYNGATRQFNISNNSLYLKAIKEKKVPFEIEVLTRENQINEYIFTTLRTSWGCSLNFLKTTYQYDLLNIQKSYLTNLSQNGLILLADEYLKLTSKGKLLADQIASDLFAPV